MFCRVIFFGSNRYISAYVYTYIKKKKKHLMFSHHSFFPSFLPLF